MDLKTLRDMPPWDWPEDAGPTILEALRDDETQDEDRLVAADLAGSSVVINDDLAGALLTIAANGRESEALRVQAQNSLAPVLQLADEEGYEGPTDAPITEQAFDRIRKSLQALYEATDTPKEVQRRALEALVRSPQEWHQDAVREQYEAGDHDWQLTAVFCMGWVPGFDEQILESLENENIDIRCEALWAAGEQGIEDAWPHVEAIVSGERAEKRLLLAAISAVGLLRPNQAEELLDHLTDVGDEDIQEAVRDTLALAGC